MKAGLVLELSSIATGYAVLDLCLKSGEVHVIEASAISPGKFLILLGGELREVEKAFQAAVNSAKESLLDSALLPNLQDSILKALYGLSKVEATREGLVVVETSSLSSMLWGLHILASKIKISLIEVKSGRGVGGKSIAFFVADNMPEALDFFIRTVKARAGFVEGQVVARPHKDFLSFFNISGDS